METQACCKAISSALNTYFSANGLSDFLILGDKPLENRSGLLTVTEMRLLGFLAFDTLLAK